MFAFFPKDQLEVSLSKCLLSLFCLLINEQKVKQLYHDAECGPSVHELVFQHEVIEIKCPTMMGWIINVKDNLLSVSDWLLLDIMYYSIFQVRRISIEGYFGEGKAPVVELTIRTDGEKEMCGDFHCGVTLKGAKLSPITIERIYEQLPSSQPAKQSPSPSQPTKQSPSPSLSIVSSTPKSPSGDGSENNVNFRELKIMSISVY